MSEKTQNIAYLGVLTALAFILGYLESLLPSLTGIPGVKAGFANIVTMFALYYPAKPRKGLAFAVLVSIVRIFLGGITYNGMSAVIYGLAGSTLSITVMFFLRRTRLFSVTAVSVAGAVAHNAGQLLLALFVLGEAVLYYFPILIISGLAAGLVIGLIASFLLLRSLHSLDRRDLGRSDSREKSR